MKQIEKLSQYIEDEIEDAEKYAKCALINKDDYPAMANTFYMLSLDELKHMGMLHDEVVKLITQYKNEHGEPPEEMKFLYNYLHEKHIEKANNVKNFQTQYKS